MNYLKIDKEDVCNGEGLRVVLWLSGCSHKCKGCQNPQTWDADSGIPFNESAKEELFRELDKDYISGLTLTGGDPLFESNLDDVLELVTEVNKRYNTTQYIDENNQNDHNILNTNADKIRLSTPNKSIWLYSGYTWESIMQYEPIDTDDFDYIEESYIDIQFEKRKKILSNCNVFIDGKFIDSQKDIKLCWRGSSNQRVISVMESLEHNKIILYCN